MGAETPRPYNQEDMGTPSTPADLNKAIETFTPKQETAPEERPVKKSWLDKVFPFNPDRREAVIKGAKIAAGTAAVVAGGAAAISEMAKAKPEKELSPEEITRAQQERDQEIEARKVLGLGTDEGEVYEEANKRAAGAGLDYKKE